ncbi:MAG: iron(III) transport system substrate-binding protein [Gaiellaceae bacterium]|jgi:iron(III) transport system substrate-binding protein|nr:iron(III) transport system substrate-binding protein [Gaiellaceae bacterium]
MQCITKRAARTVALLAIAVAALVATTVGNTASTKTPQAAPSNFKDVLNQVKSLKPAERTAKLHELAAKEGQINLYTSLSATVTKPMQSAWAAAYPDVKLNLYRASSEDVNARVEAEVSAGTSGADIIETNGTNMLIFQHQANVLIPYQKSPFAGVIPKRYRFDTFTADRLEEFVVAWNTNLVKDPPKTFQELATPKWAGKLSVEPTDSDWFAQLYMYFTQTAKKKMTTKQADAMFAGILRNAQLVNGHTNQSTLLAAGQYSIVVSGHAQSLEQLQAKKAPVAFGPPFVAPVIERPQGVGVSYRLAHPAAALLFYDWMLQVKGGQTILLQNGVQPANPYLQDNAFSTHPFTVEMDLRPIVAHFAQWQKKYESFTRLGKA